MAVSFTKVSQPYGWLGNMSPYPVEHNGKTYKTTEALFQAMRFVDEEIIESIRKCPSPMGAKMIAKKNRGKAVIEKCSESDIKNMRLCLILKIQQHQVIAKQLLGTGDQEIIEDTTNRNRKCPWGAKKIDGRWIGENLLGKIWMELRSEMKPHKTA
jgi:ribA/ribD-fused uncharacterized protein